MSCTHPPGPHATHFHERFSLFVSQSVHVRVRRRAGGRASACARHHTSLAAAPRTGTAPPHICLSAQTQGTGTTGASAGTGKARCSTIIFSLSGYHGTVFDELAQTLRWQGLGPADRDSIPSDPPAQHSVLYSTVSERPVLATP
jgi:hypothetical protein